MLPVGFRVGSHEVVEYLDGGATSEVYAAVHVETREQFAIKVFRPSLGKEFLDRIPRELVIGRAVRHPNVCQMFSDCPIVLPSNEPTLAVVTELLRGPSLDRYLQATGPLHPEALLPLLKDLVAGLSGIHKAGVVHRDIKPANVLFAGTPPAPLKIVDLGMARPLHGTKLPPMYMTIEPGLHGTPAYMPPEQILGRPVTIASDIYALGIILFRMLTGTLPFRRQSWQEIVETAHAEAPDVRSVNPSVSDRWAQVVAHCLRPDPVERFQQASDVLTAASEDTIEPSSATPPTDIALAEATVSHASVETDAMMRDAVEQARILLGRAYKLGAKGPVEIDCSGLVRRCYEQLPDGVSRQLLFFEDWVINDPREYRCAEPGDLLFLRHVHAASPSHVGVVTGVSRGSLTVIHASESRSCVVADEWNYRDETPFRGEYHVIGIGQVRPCLARVLIDEKLREIREAATEEVNAR